MSHWMESAVGNGQYADNLLGENQNGDLFVPSRTQPDWWDREFNPRNPLHWPYYLRSRVRRSVVMIETSW
jgi:hypothetical protein